RGFHVTGVQACALPSWAGVRGGLEALVVHLDGPPHRLVERGTASPLTIGTRVRLDVDPGPAGQLLDRFVEVEALGLLDERVHVRSEEHTSELQSRENLV